MFGSTYFSPSPSEKMSGEFDLELRLEVVSDGCEHTPKDWVSEWFDKRKARAHTEDSLMDCSMLLGVRRLPVNSFALAVNSPMFSELIAHHVEFELGESGETTYIELQINDFEEDAMMHLLHFIHKPNLPQLSPKETLALLVLADKLEIRSCIKICVDRLVKEELTKRPALLFLLLPSAVRNSELVQPLAAAGEKFLEDFFSEDPTFPSESGQASISAPGGLQVHIYLDNVQNKAIQIKDAK